MKKARREFAKSASIKKPKTKYAPKHKKNLNQCFWEKRKNLCVHNLTSLVQLVAEQHTLHHTLIKNYNT